VPRAREVGLAFSLFERDRVLLELTSLKLPQGPARRNRGSLKTALLQSVNLSFSGETIPRKRSEQALAQDKAVSEKVTTLRG
jgi:hypothetical protein